MSHLILSGGGTAKQTKKLDELLVSLIPKHKRLLYIPVAMPETTYSRGECFDWVSTKVKPFKFIKMDMWTDLSNRKYSELKNYGAVYIGGGNTFHLLNHIRKSHFDKLLLKYLKDGGVVYGGSAGAIIFGQDIRTAAFGKDSDINFDKITNFQGLNLIQNCAVQCHYLESDDKEIFKYVKRHGMNVIALYEETGIHISKGRMKVVGYKPAYLFNSHKKIKISVNKNIPSKRQK